MRLTWKERLEHEPQLSSFEAWPHIDLELLENYKRKIFLRNSRIVTKVLSGSSIKSTAEKYGVSGPFISQLLTRCLCADGLEHPPLTKALIPGIQLKHGERKAPLSNLSNPAGSRGALTYLLKNVPKLGERLDEIISSSVKRDSFSQNLTPKYFHKEFLRLLSDANWPKTTYPFDQQNMGYESCRKYLKRRVAELSMPEPKQRREVLVRKAQKLPYQEIQIDAQIQDVNTHLNLEFNGNLVPLRLSRVTLFLATDVATGCHLAYQLCLAKDPTQIDLLNLLEKIHKPWEKLTLKTPQLAYEPGACLPSALGELYRHAGIGMIKLDNALCHMSHMVRDYVCNTLGATLNFGLPAQPKGRSAIEHAFKLLNEHTHRFASTTGSGPNDPIKESKVNQKKIPTITINAFKEILDVLITSHNVTALERLGGLTPLDVMQMRMSEFAPLSFNQINRKTNPFLRQKKVSVRWIQHENRSPHINFEGNRYRGDCLNQASLANTKIAIEYDVRDIRKINALTLKGKLLGVLKAPKSWQNYPHSIGTRKRIRKLTKEFRMRDSDPLSGYFSYLLENKELPKQATELIRVHEEYTSNGISSITVLKASKQACNTKKLRTKTIGRSATANIPKWEPKLIEGLR